jgi:hypothetical protein
MKTLPLLLGGAIVAALIGYGAMQVLEERSGVEVERDGENTTVTTEDGSVTVGTNTQYPATWPSDAPKHQNGNITFSGNNNPKTGETGSAVIFTTQDSVSTLTKYYTEQLTAKGWTIDTTASVNTVNAIVARKDNKVFGVTMADPGNGSQVTVTASVTTSIETPEPDMESVDTEE